MLDLGTSFLASVSRDPRALALVDGETRLTYTEWFRVISATVAGLDRLGLKPGDHLVTVLQNRHEAATLHWACQFAGIVITPINWRAKAEEIDFAVENAQARAIAYEPVSAASLRDSAPSQRIPRIAVGTPPGPGETAFADLAATEGPPRRPGPTRRRSR